MHCPDHGCGVPAGESVPCGVREHPAWAEKGWQEVWGGVPADPVLLRLVLRSPVGQVMEEVVEALLGKKERGHRVGCRSLLSPSLFWVTAECHI